jgi:hypothetical protein
MTVGLAMSFDTHTMIGFILLCLFDVAVRRIRHKIAADLTVRKDTL